MKTITLISTLILVLAVLIIIGGCATTPKTQEEREGVEPEVFFRSVMNGDFAEVKRLIEEGVDINARDNEGHTTLMYAAGYGHTEVAKLLIEEGADINARDNEGTTALLIASKYGWLEVAQLLIGVGADANARTRLEPQH